MELLNLLNVSSIQAGADAAHQFSEMKGINVPSDVGTEITEKFDALFPTWPTMVATILSLLLLLLLLTKLLYKPVKKMHDDRRKYIQDNIDMAEQDNHEAAKDREKANGELIQARMDAADIIQRAKTEAEQVRANQLALAHSEAQRLIINAKSEIEHQQVKFKEESRESLVKLALAAAEKVIEKEVDSKSNKNIIDNFIRNKK